MELTLRHGIGRLDPDDAWVLDGWWWWSQVSNRRDGNTDRAKIYIVGRPRTLRAAIRSGLDEIASTFPMHRLILGMGRYANDPRDVDHINGDGLDNRRGNLRIPARKPKAANLAASDPGSRSQNLANSASRGGSSTFKGVSFDPRTGRWKAQITIEGKNKNLGRYDTEEQAALAYNLAAREAWGEYARLNLIPDGVQLPVGTRGSSRYRGVAWDKNRNLWVAQVMVDGKHRHLGRFATEEEAALAYNAAAAEAFGDRARLNIV